MLSIADVSEREVYRDYDRDRRLRVTRNFAAAFFTLLVLALITTPFTLGIRPTVTEIVSTLWPPSLAVIAYGVSWYLTLRHQDIAAAAVFIGATLFVVVEFQIEYAFRDGVGPLTLAIMAAYGNNIANSGLIGNTWLLGIVTVVENLLTVFMLIALPLLLGEPFIHQLPVVLATLIMVQWGMALSFYFGGRQNLRTLRELGDIRVAYARARQVEDIKNQFITSVNHELRTPVMTMIGWIENLQRTAAKLATTVPNESTQAEAAKMLAHLKRAESAGQHLTALINSILDANRLDQDLAHFTPRPVNVNDAVRAAIALLDPPEGERRERVINLHIAADLEILGEAVWVQQIASNLLSNAIKYSAPGSPIDVSAGDVIEQRGRKDQVKLVEIAVRDYGLGVPPAQVPLLFQKFVRLPRDLASTTIGNGLGLWLCRQLAEAMHGRIWVESTGVEGEGATFLVRLPLPVPVSVATPSVPLALANTSA